MKWRFLDLNLNLTREVILRFEMLLYTMHINQTTVKYCRINSGLKFSAVPLFIVFRYLGKMNTFSLQIRPLALSYTVFSDIITDNTDNENNCLI
jgi:hypothetical protein